MIERDGISPQSRIGFKEGFEEFADLSLPYLRIWFAGAQFPRHGILSLLAAGWRLRPKSMHFVIGIGTTRGTVCHIIFLFVLRIP